ncbi:MAG: efflux RND transporter permease subunit [Spirochaetaceae bacterium]|nr:efflux RND transporter permease subunit [Myxococcales bacterium]MCB9726048.1 efflux RND transporter permease subunit [Spirochaetaceae bacterium]
MWLSDTSVRRPVLATVLSLLLIAFGVLSFQNLPLRELPDVDPPIVSVQTTYIGASASVVENRVTKPIEERLAGIEGIRKIVSESSEGVSQITVEFELSRDIDNAANDVRDRVSMSRDDIPDEADAPEIYKAQSDASPIMWLNLSSPDLDQLELTDYADRRLVDRFSVVDGVARVVLSGAKHYSMRIWLDRIALAARELTVADVETALRQQNVELPAGRIESIERDLTVRVDRGYSSAEDFRALVVKRGDEGQLVRLGDVARVEVGPLESSGGFRGNGHPRLGIGIVKQSTANTVSVANGVIEEVGRVQSSLPPHMLLETGWNSADYVQASVDEVYRTLGIAMVLVVFVIYLFLGTKRAALIPAVTVPICLIATFTGLWAFGLSINLLTLLALILSIGLVVDDSIVVLENVQRRIELGEPPLIAAYRGTREVGFAVIATTLVVIAVFVPIAFLEGTTGRIFRELAVTVSVSVAVSSLVALTLSAMLCSKILARSQPDAGLARFASRVVASSQEAYGRVLEAALRRRGVIVAIVVATVALAGWLVGLVPRELEPKEDRGAFMIFMQAPEGASFEYTDAHMKMLEEQVLFPLVDEGAIEFVLTRVPFGYTTDTSMNTGMVITVMAPWGERDVTVDEVMGRVAAEASAIPGVIAFPISPSTLGRSTSSRPVQLVVGGSRHEEVGAWQEQVIAEASERVPSVRGLLGSYRPTQPQLRVEVDRDRAADLGVAVAVVGRTLETMLGSARVTTYEDRGEEYEVVLQAEAAQRASPTDLTNLYVRSDRSGLLIPLSNLVRITERADAGKLRRFNRLPAATIEASLAPGVSLGDGLHDLETMARQILPEDAHFDYDGDSLEFVESSSAAYFTFLLALLIVFLVLAAQFESFVHPAVIMLTVPLAVAGALAGLHLATLGAHAGLWHTTGSLNIYSQIGMTILIGLAAKNGILLVEFTNQLRAQGIAFERAIREAARARLRPILMTGISTALGALPLVLGSGPGSGGRRAIGIVVFAGVLSATFLTLFVVPVAYSFVARRTHTPGELDQALDELDRSTPAVVGLGGELEG